MKVTVTLIPGNHPEYLTELINSSNQELLWKFQARFNNYRDLANLVEKYSSNVMNGVVFPPTYSYSSYGFKLSNIQLVERKELLEQWLQQFVNKFNEFHQDIILKFYSMVTNSNSEPTREEFGRFCLAFSNTPVSTTSITPNDDQNKKGKLKASTSGEWTTVTSAKKGAKREPTNVLTVRVSRSSISNGHQQYETIITYDKTARPFRMERVFKYYRKLALELAEHGVNVGAIGADEDGQSDPVRRKSGVKNANGEVVEISLPVFPESFVISSFGLKLTEGQLQQRCQKLHDWMRDLLCAFYLLPEDCQVLIINFLMLDEDETVDNIIIYSLKNGWILNRDGEIAAVPMSEDGSSATTVPPPPPPSKEISNRINNIVNMVHSKFTGSKKEDEDLNGVKPLTVGALQEQEETRRKNEMLLVQTVRGKEIQGHPSYETSLSTEDANLVTVIKFFKDYRQLALNLSNQGINVGTIEESQSVLSGVTEVRRSSVPTTSSSVSEGDLPPFPRTFRRSSLGIKLPDKDLQERCSGLDSWMKAICQRYSQFSAESQVAINQFFEFNEADEKHKLAMRSLSTGFVYVPNSVITSAPGTLSQISEEIPTADPSIKTEQNEPAPENPSTAPSKFKSITNFVNAKFVGHKLKENLSNKPSDPSMSPNSEEETERLRIEKESCTLNVNVTRNGNVSSHPTYELIISCSKENTRHSLVYMFKDYRQLALQLEKEGINVGAIGEEENENSNTDKSFSGSIAQPTPTGDLDLPPFPKTYTRSAFGLKLGEAELQSRAEGLDRWIRAVCQKYYLYSGVIQHHIDQFLKLDPVHPSHYLILRSLSVGWIGINPMDALPPQYPAQSTRRNSALGKLFQPMTSRDEINEVEGVPASSTTDDDDWVDISSKNPKNLPESPCSPEISQQVTTSPKSEQHLGLDSVNEEKDEDDVIHITPAMKTPSGCMPGLCIIS